MASLATAPGRSASPRIEVTGDCAARLNQSSQVALHPLAVGDSPVIQTNGPAYQTTTMFATLAAVWLAMRLVFFVGYVGSDDMYHIRFAVLWDRAPANHWEIRLLYNSILRASLNLFGRVEWAAILPSLAASTLGLATVVTIARYWFTPRCAWWAGLIAATLPIDVESATVVSAYTPMTALLVFGTALTIRKMTAEQRYGLASQILAALSFALAVLMHRIAMIYVAALIVGLAIRGPRRYARFNLAIIIATVAALTMEHTYCARVYDDAALPVRLALAQSLSENPDAPLMRNGVLNAAFFAWPFTHFLASNAFGVSLLAAAIGLWRCRGALPQPLVVLLMAGGFFWAYLSFGSQSPIDYRPFWRMMRFWHPLLPLVVVGAALFVIGFRRRWISNLTGAGLIASHVLLLSASGAWGRNAKISRELLAYALNHPEQRFITDYHTLNELYIENGVQGLSHIVTTDDTDATKLLDRTSTRISSSNLLADDRLLVNPLNVARRPEFAKLIEERGGHVVYETAVRRRMICDWLPESLAAQWEWCVRQPAARVIRMMPVGPIAFSTVDAGDGAQSNPYTGK